MPVVLRLPDATTYTLDDEIATHLAEGLRLHVGGASAPGASDYADAIEARLTGAVEGDVLVKQGDVLDLLVPYLRNQSLGATGPNPLALYLTARKWNDDRR